MNESEDKRIAYLIIAVSIIGIIVVGILILIKPTESGFSEVYFEEHENLPKLVHLGEYINISFTVACHEKNRTNYNYEVVFDDEEIANGSVILNPEESITINISFKPKNTTLYLVKEWGNTSSLKIYPKNYKTLMISGNESKILGGLYSWLKLPAISGKSMIQLMDLTNLTDNVTIYNYTWKGTFGDPTNLKPVNISDKYYTGFGFKVIREDILAKRCGDYIILSKTVINKEYRYEFKRVKVIVHSDKGKDYEIYFWTVVVDGCFSSSPDYE